MKNLFKKNANETVKVQNPQEMIISAQEALDITSAKWTTMPTEKIFEIIKKEAQLGERRAYFFDAYLTGAQLTQLEELGYTVKIANTSEKTPYFKVSW